MIAGDDADALGRVDDQLEDPQQNLEPVALVVEQVAEKDDPRPARRLARSRRDQRQRGLERQQVAVQVADDPERRRSSRRSTWIARSSGSARSASNSRPGRPRGRAAPPCARRVAHPRPDRRRIGRGRESPPSRGRARPRSGRRRDRLARLAGTGGRSLGADRGGCGTPVGRAGAGPCWLRSPAVGGRPPASASRSASTPAAVRPAHGQRQLDDRPSPRGRPRSGRPR